MYQGFWQSLPRPIVGLSPMDGVTDQPFRHIQKKYGRPDVVITEFTSAEGLARNALALLNDFIFDETQRPIVAQIFGSEPESFRTTALIVAYLGFDGIDINMGCPAKNVSQHGSGAALIRTPELAQEIIRQTQLGIQDWEDGKTLDEIPSLKEKMKAEIYRRHELLPETYRQRRPLPLSIKTRIGYDHPVVEEWIPKLLEMKPAAISLHGRTLKQLYSGEADWEAITRAAKIVHETETLILGNGDISSVEIAENRIQESGVDGVLIGRATWGNPWILSDLVSRRSGQQAINLPSTDERFELALEHARFFEQTYPDRDFLPMRKHMAWYVKGFPNASDLRTALVLANSANEIEQILNQASK